MVVQPHRNVGYTLHPSIAKNLLENARIADVACGTAQWSLYLSEQLPKSVKFDGFDISDSQFPKRLPENMELHVADAKKPFPAEYHGQFDVVHIRLLTIAMQEPDWGIVTDKCKALLKSGGAIQWEEADFTKAQFVHATNLARPSTIDYVSETVQSHFKARFSYGWSTLPQEFEKAGLVGGAQDIMKNDRVPETRKGMILTAMKGCLDGASRMDNLWPPEQLEKFRKEVAEVNDQTFVFTVYYFWASTLTISPGD